VRVESLAVTGVPAAKAYLAHLTKGSDLLRAEKIDEARAELEQALALRPGDAKIMNLLGLTYFRLARYPEAQAIYGDLVKRQPQDPALRLNLGLVLLKRGDVDDAIRELTRARELDPSQTRTMGYLGLAFARKGRFALARDAFAAAGQDELAKEMEQQLDAELAGMKRKPAVRQGNGVTRGLTGEYPVSVVGLEASASLPAVAPSPPPKPEAATPPPRILAKPAGEVHPDSLAGYTARRSLRPEGGDAAFEAMGQALVVRVRGRILARTDGVIATGGAITTEPAARRVRGRVTPDAFVGDGGMSLASGQGHLVAIARGTTFTTLKLVDEAVYLREDLVFAFEERLLWENGHVPGSNGSIPVLSLRGEGGLALRTRGALLGIEVRGDKILDVHASALAGWTGNVVPRLVTHPGGRAHTVEFSGEGTVFVEEPAR
jgi:predicted negative regulator of RcsB-dependent stress response